MGINEYMRLDGYQVNNTQNQSKLQIYNPVISSKYTHMRICIKKFLCSEERNLQ